MLSKIEIGDTVFIDKNISQILKKYGFDKAKIKSISDKFSETNQTVVDMYYDEDTNKNWVVIGKSYEIPLECCKKV